VRGRREGRGERSDSLVFSFSCFWLLLPSFPSVEDIVECAFRPFFSSLYFLPVNSRQAAFGAFEWVGVFREEVSACLYCTIDILSIHLHARTLAEVSKVR